jgi:heat shock protein HslJ
MPRRTPRAVAALLVLAVAAACSSGGSAGTATTVTKPAGVPLTGTHWVLSDATNLGVPTTDISVTAEFRAGVLGGSSGCNSYRTEYRTHGDALTIGASVSGTLRQCAPSVDAVERAYRARLPQVASFSIVGERLTLAGSNGDALLVYQALEGASALKGKWTTTGFYTGSAVQSVIVGSTLTAEFAHGDMSGESGCNSFAGPYVAKGSTIRLGPFRSTLKACTDPALETQEQQYLAALDEASTFQATTTTLHLLRSDGGIAATFER